MNFSAGDWLVVLITAEELLACLCYARRHAWPDVLLWLGAAVINGSILWRKGL